MNFSELTSQINTLKTKKVWGPGDWTSKMQTQFDTLKRLFFSGWWTGASSSHGHRKQKGREVRADEGLVRRRNGRGPASGAERRAKVYLGPWPEMLGL